MKVIEEINHPNLPNHTIQFGISTWTENEPVNMQTESVRRAVYNSGGTFSPHGSSEIPMEDMPLLIRECVKRSKISKWTLFKMLFLKKIRLT
jgi:hypothetical protein